MRHHFALTPEQRKRQTRRIEAVRALARGLSQTQVAAMFGTTCASVSNWSTRFRTGGLEELEARPMGRPRRAASAVRRLGSVQLAVATRFPDQLGLAGALWTWRSVQALVYRSCKTEMSRWTVARYLQDWGFISPVSHGRPPVVDERSAAGRLVYEFACSTLTTAQPSTHGEYFVLWALGRRGETAFAAYPAPLRSADIIDFLERLHIHIDARLLVHGPKSLLDRPELRRWRASRAKAILLKTGAADRKHSRAAN